MMQTKRILISLLVVVLLTCCTLTAFAAANEAPAMKFAVSVSSDTAIQGEDGSYAAEKDAVLNFTVTAEANDLSIDQAKLVVDFDADCFELVENSVQLLADGYTDMGNAAVNVSDGQIKVDFLSFMAGSVLKGDLISFSVKVKDFHGTAKVTAAMPLLKDSELEAVDTLWTNAETVIDVHTYGELQSTDDVPDDCTKGAKTFYPCVVEGCSKLILVSEPNEASHDASGKAPNCTTAQICAREGCKVEVNPKLGHLPNIEKATCMTDLYCTREDCPNKGEVLEEKLPHDASGPDATCMTPKVCKYGCGTVLAELPHDATGPDATCTSPKVCKYGCGTVLAPKVAHDTTGPDATCTTAKVCKYGCGTELAPKLGHDVSGPAATCTTAKICARESCKAVLLAALGHDESGKAATCTTDKVCARANCNFVLDERFGHDESGAAATCLKAKTCVTCGEVLVAKLTAPESHVYGEWVVETPATMSAAGLQYKVCTVCEEKVTEEIPEKSSAWLIILIIVGVLVLGGGGFAAYWFLLKNKKAKAESEETTENNSEEKTEEVTEEATEAPAEEATAEATEEKTEE